MAPTPAPSILPHGTRLAQEKYAVGPVIGQGNFGITYKGGDLQAKRYVAIKEFFPLGAARYEKHISVAELPIEVFEKQKAAFLQEAKVLAGLTHESIVRVFDVFEENGTAYVVLELLEGEPLAKRIESHKRLDETEVVNLGVRLAAALAEIHEAGILHRDINPDTIMLCGSRPVFANFGTIRAFQPRNQISATGYAPIEQFSAHGRQTSATDVYGLAATLYYALTGYAPVSATERSNGTLLPDPSALLATLTPYVEKALVKALYLEADERVHSAADFGALLKGHTVRYAAPTALLRSEQFMEQERPQNQNELLNLTSILKNHTSYVNDLEFSPNSTHLVSVGQDRLVIVWNWVSGAMSRRLAIHESAINRVTFSHDGNWFATAGKDERILLWPTGQRLQGHPENSNLHTQGEVYDLAFSPIHRALAWSDAASLKLWDWDAPPPNVIIDSGSQVHLFAFSPDGNSIIAASTLESGLIYVLTGHSLQPLAEFRAHKSAVTGLAYSPDGQLIATCGLDGYVRCWDANSKQLKWEQREQFENLQSLAWSPDGELIAVGKREAVSIWTVGGEHWRQFKRHTKAVRAVAFAPNPPATFKYVLASASQDQTIAVHRIRA